jgi:transposase-like protein
VNLLMAQIKYAIMLWAMEMPKEKKKCFSCKSPDSNNGEISEKNVFQHHPVKSNIQYRDKSESSYKFLLFISCKTIFLQKKFSC